MNDKSKSHWAYQPVKMPEVPEVKQKGWVKNNIDNFILAKLEENQMVPQHIANRETLLRRASYDLIGLPPTPDELYRFKVDSAPNAFEKAVDRLLASPQYGERWGRFWLDSARYADTTGDGGNRNQDYRYAYAWTYRDYVVKAYNDDKPYDQFLKEQIAADLLPDAAKNPDSLAALGFITVGKRFPNNNDTIDERIDTLSKATMALTVSCARCHDHKFDPIPTADYYALHGVFSSINEPNDKPMIGKPPTPAESADYEKKLAELEQKNKDIYFDSIKNKSAEYRKNISAYLQIQMLSGKESAENVAEKRKLIADNKLDTDLIRFLGQPRANDPVFAPLAWFAECPASELSNVAPKLLQDIQTDKAINPLVAQAFKGVSASSIKDMKSVTDVYAKLFGSLDQKAEAYIQAARVTSGDKIQGFDDGSGQLACMPFKVEPASKLTTAHLREIDGNLALGNNPGNQFRFNAINALELTHPGDPGRAMVVTDANPHDSPIFIHGDQSKHGPIAPRQFLQILSGADRKPFKIGSGRLELAQDIASKDNPLTARVAVNRAWMHHFGEGFVHTPDDMGVQSEPPTHPQLIDYLSYKFMEEGWSMKKLHKMIMLSATYQQSSDTNATFAKKDPENKLLWRASLRRLDFESIRDSLLMFTGNLDRRVGGRPVNLSDEPYSFRRSIYGYIDRGKLPELVQEFDFPDPNRPNSRRTSTIVPQQALFLMNSPMSADVARRVVTRPEFLAAPDDNGRVRALYIELYQRETPRCRSPDGRRLLPRPQLLRPQRDQRSPLHGRQKTRGQKRPQRHGHDDGRRHRRHQKRRRSRRPPPLNPMGTIRPGPPLHQRTGVRQLNPIRR